MTTPSVFYTPLNKKLCSLTGFARTRRAHMGGHLLGSLVGLLSPYFLSFLPSPLRCLPCPLLLLPGLVRRAVLRIRPLGLFAKNALILDERVLSRNFLSNTLRKHPSFSTPPYYGLTSFNTTLPLWLVRLTNFRLH
jgi:hypothetical protein